MENLVIYRGPRYLNVTATRKQYVIEIGDIEWDADVIDFNNTFIFETAIEPYDKDEDDETECIYGVTEEFYAELMETLSNDVCEIWNEPELISITEIIEK